jgi:uncharacterized MAPEG superfamily protein
MLTTPVPFVLLAWLLAYAPLFVTAWSRAKMEGGFDNRHPRAQQAQLTGIGARAQGAHNNALEAFPAFAAAAILCMVRGGDPILAQGLCVAFVVARVSYLGFYLADIPLLRSTMWTVGALATLGLFVVAMRA